MNDTLDSIFSRRSIRSYREDPVPSETRDLIVKAGLYAPSARNIQPWHFTVIECPTLIARITEEVRAATIRQEVKRYLEMVKSPRYRVNFGAPMFVIVSADPDSSNCPAEDCALALGNMFLAAHSLGLGSCWINQLGPIADDPVFRSLLTQMGVPSPNRIYGSAAFGYRAGAMPDAPKRREGTVNVITRFSVQNPA